MGLPRGLGHFSNFLKDFEKDYVIIGGGAASVYLGDVGLEFRATKDIDLVLFTNDSIALNKKISEYIFRGGYQTKEQTEAPQNYYRFSKPKEKDFPEIIEIFARNDNEIVLREGQYIIPIQNDVEAKLSAILLDDEYFTLIKNNSVKSAQGYSIINSYANICLKARAFIELQERKEEPRKIRKHLKDILRLVPTLGDGKSNLLEKPNRDLKEVYSIINDMPNREVKKVIGSILTKDEILDILNNCFSVA